MGVDLKITKAEVEPFTWQIRKLGHGPIGKPWYDPESTTTMNHVAVKLYTDGGVVGEYVGGGDAGELASTLKRLLGTNAFDREKVYNDLRIHYMAKGPGTRAFIDVLLWDIAGKAANLPIYALIGGYRTKLPAYAATIEGATTGILSTIDSFADYAEWCLEKGARGFKIHPGPWPEIAKHVQVVRAVGARVGRKMDLMLDAYCLYETFGDAVKVGRACDDAGFFWYEDPYHDGGITPFAYNKLRELIRTPLLIGEKIQTLQERMNMALAKGTDYIRGDAQNDGITGTLKLAHAAESVGLDIELHGAHPPHRHLMAAIRNSNYYEFGWTHPEIASFRPPVYVGDYSDGFPGGLGADGYVHVPEGPGLGVTYDWEFITSHSLGKVVVG